MDKEKDFFKICFNIVAGLEVKNESQTIAKEVVLSEIENLEQENKQLREAIDKTIDYINKNMGYVSERELLDILNEVSE